MSLAYDIDDIEKFIHYTKQLQHSDEYQSLQKLLSVKDKIAIFHDISKYELKALVYDVKFKRVKFKEYILKEREKSVAIYYILQGECQAFKDKKLIGTLHEGDTFGEIGVITNTPRSADILCSSKEAILLEFKLHQEKNAFNAQALATIYRNLAISINEKLQQLNIAAVKR